MKKIPRPNDILRFDGASETRTKHAMSTVFLLDGGGGGTAAAASPPFRHCEPALCGSHPL